MSITGVATEATRRRLVRRLVRANRPRCPPEQCYGEAQDRGERTRQDRSQQCGGEHPHQGHERRGVGSTGVDRPCGPDQDAGSGARDGQSGQDPKATRSGVKSGRPLRSASVGWMRDARRALAMAAQLRRDDRGDEAGGEGEPADRQVRRAPGSKPARTNSHRSSRANSTLIGAAIAVATRASTSASAATSRRTWRAVLPMARNSA